MSQIEVKENAGELYIEIPGDMMDRLGWKNSDDFEWIDNKNGTFTLIKTKKVDVELEFTEEELFKYMLHAHEQGISFSAWVEHVMKEFVSNQTKHESPGKEI